MDERKGENYIPLVILHTCRIKIDHVVTSTLSLFTESDSAISEVESSSPVECTSLSQLVLASVSSGLTDIPGLVSPD